jgi:hypothetical protein
MRQVSSWIATLRRIAALSGLTLALAWGSSAEAGFIHLTAPASGQRTEASGQVVTLAEFGSDNLSFTLDWSVSFDGTNYTYTYTLDGFDEPGISHFSISASDGRNGSDDFEEENVVFSSSGDDKEVGMLNEGKFGAPSDLYGIKFDDGGSNEGEAPTTYTLITDRAPVWGSFFAKAGSEAAAFNSGWQIWGDYLADTSIQNFVFNSNEWIAVPDSLTTITTAVPEPTSMAVGGLVMIGAAVSARRRRKT